MLAFNQIWITLGPIVVINTILITSYFSYQLWVRGQKDREFAGAKRGGSKLVGSVTRDWWFWTTNPIVKLFIKLKMGPNVLTATGFLFSVLAAFLFAIGSFGYAGWVMIFGASFDMFDGRVARITGKSSRSGAFFDAVMDRFGEGACLLGLAFYFRASFMLPVVIAALVGSLLVSYTKARAEGMGVQCNVGTMQRPERIVYIGVASIMDPIVNLVLGKFWESPPPILLMLALVLVAAMTIGTAVYRMIYVMNALDTADKRGKESIPQLITRLSTHEGREKFWERARYGYDRERAASAHVVLFLINGISAELLSTLAKRGDLPNIQKYALDGGCETKAVSTFPSAVGPASAPFVTGCFPGTCDIPGVRWFDRAIPPGRVLTINRFRDYLRWGAYAMDHDLSASTRTIFEYSRQAVNIFGMLNRGCGLIRDPALLRLGNLFYRANRDSDVAAAEESAFSWFSSAVKRETDFILYSFPTAEFTGEFKPSPELAGRSLKRIDDYIGKAAKLLGDHDMWKDSAIFLAGVHGVSSPSRFFDIANFLSRRYKTCTTGPTLRNWHDSDLITLLSGTSMSHIYARKNEDWSDLSFFEDVERRGIIGSLLEQEEIDILAGRSVEGGIVVQSRRGRAHILEDADGRITYLTKGGDPFGFAPVPQVLSSADILRTTENTSYPDGILQMLQIFRSSRTGDIVVSAKHDAALFAAGGENANIGTTHGSIAREHTIVPFLSNIPIEPKVMRTADIFALIMNRLGIEAMHDMDGAWKNQNI